MRSIDKDYTKKVFGKNVKKYRLNNCYSQERLCELTDSSLSYISDLERGVVGASFDKIASFCNVFDIELEQLFDEAILEERLPDRITEYQK